MLKTVVRFIYTKYWEIRFVEHCWKIYIHKILGNTLFQTLWKDLFTQNTGKYCLLNTVGRFIYTKYWEILSVERFIETKYWEILYVEQCGKIYWHKILGNSFCWTLWEDLFTQNTGKYFMLNTGKIYLYKIMGNNWCWTLWEDLFTQKNTGNYFLLSIVGRFIYRK